MMVYLRAAELRLLREEAARSGEGLGACLARLVRQALEGDSLLEVREEVRELSRRVGVLEGGQW
jgi:hypothetical protein